MIFLNTQKQDQSYVENAKRILLQIEGSQSRKAINGFVSLFKAVARIRIFVLNVIE
jgi:hypothetical protein